MNGVFAPELQVMKYVAELRGRWCWFRVFTTGSSSHYVFDQLVGDSGISSGLQFPVLKKELRRGIRSALANGWGHRRTDANRIMPLPPRDEETWGLV